VLLLALGIIPLLLSTANDHTNKVLFALGPLWTSYGLIRQALLAGSAIVLVLFLLSLLPQLKRRHSVRRARTFLVLALLAELLALWLLGDHSDASPFPIGPLPVTDYAIWLLVSIFVVLLVFYTFSLILTMTTSPMALIEGMSMLLSPLRRLRLPVDDFTLMALLALRFVPTLLEEVELLLKAQTSRGADMTSGTLRERMQSLVALFVPLIQGTFRRASELATALEARGYEVEGRQTRLYETSLSRTDYIALALVFIIALLSLLI
ncbi:MAG: energy-coupling factor transporter transmembrane protein EcfT, partial [Ktedonobacteraceae bacterium]|nr:energy-coupling factor transporter transmembrane protein EcfT [Ktedonobacteraceae bacterium]